MLEMKNNQLTEIHASSFGNRAKLQALFLENNFIRSIDPKFMHESSISMLHMEGNFCFSGNTKARDESMDTNVKRCFKNHKPTVKTTSTTSTTTVVPTTTTSKLITTTLKSTTTETTTTKKPKTTTKTSEVPKITEETSTTPIIEKESLISSVQLTSSAQTFSQSTESLIVTTTRTPKSIVAFKQPCGKVQYGIPALSDGEKYVRGQFPWNIAIFQTNGKFICSGVLVDKRKVVTAAKCMYKIVRDTPIELLPRDIIVVLGSHNIYKLFETQKLSVAVQTIHIHKDYKFESTNMDADIAVIILDTEINSGKFIKPICLIDSDENILSVSDGYLATFGHNNSMAMNHIFTPRKLEIQIRDNLDCVISNEAFAYISSDRTFCALPNDEADVCVEDYGSGLYVKYEGSYYLRGILSTAISDGKSKCIVGSDSLYTDVSKYSKWIEELPLYTYEDVVDEYFGLVWT